MKKLIILALVLLVYTTAFAQNAFFDSQYLTTTSTKDIDAIIAAGAAPANNISLSEQESLTLTAYKNFLTNPFDATIITSDLDIVQLKKAILKYNDYVAKQFELAKNSLNGVGYSTDMALGTTGSAASALTNLATGGIGNSSDIQTAILDALVKYYAEEFRKAQLVSYMQLFKATIGKSGEMKVLFPNTYSKLSTADPSKFPDLGNEFKSIFNDDLKAILDNLINHIDTYQGTDPDIDATFKIFNKAHNDLIKKSPYYNSVKIAADIGTKLINNYQPVDLFNYLDNTYYKAAMLTDTNNVSKVIVLIHGLNLLQHNLLDTTKDATNKVANQWINLNKLSSITSIKQWSYFTGLIFQQDKEYFKKYFWDPGAGAAIIITSAQLDQLKNQVYPVISALVELQNFKNGLKDENLKDNYIVYMNMVTSLIKKMNFNNAAAIDEYLKNATYVMNIYDNVRKKEYSNSIYYATLIATELVHADPNIKLDYLTTVDKYTTFMADVVNAKNSDEIKDVISKNVAPAASFILKREYRTTLSVTGQPGYFVGGEYLNKKWALNSGITLPLGFEFTTKLKYGTDNSSSLGIFVQLVDLGAMLNFRVSDSTSALPDKVNVSQIFSPGLSLTYGFKNSPLTIGFGYQKTPELRDITLASGNVISPKGDRVFLRLAWDIPLINISRSKEH